MGQAMIKNRGKAVLEKISHNNLINFYYFLSWIENLLNPNFYYVCRLLLLKAQIFDQQI